MNKTETALMNRIADNGWTTVSVEKVSGYGCALRLRGTRERDAVLSLAARGLVKYIERKNSDLTAEYHVTAAVTS